MFICDVTGKVTPSKTPMRKVVTKIRNMTYLNHRFNEETEEMEEVLSKGWEIVEEINVSPEGLEILIREGFNPNAPAITV